MDGTNATQIRSLLLEAADAIDRAMRSCLTLDSDDRALLSEPLDEVSLQPCISSCCKSSICATPATKSDSDH